MIVIRVPASNEFLRSGNDETIGSFMVFMLRKTLKHTDFVKFHSYKFEVADIDSYRINQQLVSPVSMHVQ